MEHLIIILPIIALALILLAINWGKITNYFEPQDDEEYEHDLFRDDDPKKGR